MTHSFPIVPKDDWIVTTTQLDDGTAIVTGGSTGIGEAMVIDGGYVSQ